MNHPATPRSVPPPGPAENEALVTPSNSMGEVGAAFAGLNPYGEDPAFLKEETLVKAPKVEHPTGSPDGSPRFLGFSAKRYCLNVRMEDGEPYVLKTGKSMALGGPPTVRPGSATGRGLCPGPRPVGARTASGQDSRLLRRAELTAAISNLGQLAPGRPPRRRLPTEECSDR
jgi:hypothetical protein